MRAAVPNSEEPLNFYDTFLDAEHLKQVCERFVVRFFSTHVFEKKSFPGDRLEFDGGAPPYAISQSWCFSFPLTFFH